MVRLLVLGGSAFVGRATVEAALRRDWQVTVFNRGSSGSPDGVEQICGDRTVAGDLEPLRSRRWDAVIDTWRYAPLAVQLSCEALAGRVGHYGYVSSISVYQWPPPTPVTEGAPVVAARDVDADDYAGAKSTAEQAIAATFDGRALLGRCGLILGPCEYAGRLPWWLLRLASYDRVLAPEPADRRIQYIDVRDLAEWLLDQTAAGRTGAFNLVCPPDHATMGGLLTACADVVGSTAKVTWVPEDALLAAGVQPWIELPIWVPRHGELAAMYDVNVDKSIAAGLICRPVGGTVADTWTWLMDADPATTGQHKPWLDRSREVALLNDL
jgi:nucleoside-diphosphate-sugar epimerase